jgi:glutamate racemase
LFYSYNNLKILGEVTKMEIGFFDSGIGGLTVLYQALKLLPNEDYLYYADTIHVPYGEKSKSEIKEYIMAAADFIAKHNVKALVVACNAATSAAIADLRNKYAFPVIGIEPAVKPAIQYRGANKRVLVLATRLTLQEEKYTDLVKQLDQEQIVDGLPMPTLVTLAENFEFDEDIVLPYLREQLSPLPLDQYETVVLGCTHFPFFKDMLRKVFPPSVAIIDGSIGTAKNLKRILEARHDLNQSGTGRIDFYNSGVKVTDPYLLSQYAQLLKRLHDIEMA